MTIIRKPPNTGALPPAATVSTFDELCLFLGGSHDSFTGLLLRLITKADQGNRYRLRQGFPREVLAFELWNSGPPDLWTAETLAVALECIGPAR